MNVCQWQGVTGKPPNGIISAQPLAGLVRMAQEDDVLIYAIGLLSEEDKREARMAQTALNLLVLPALAQHYVRVATPASVVTPA